MSYDGTLKFDTEIDGKGFTSGVSRLGSIVGKGLAAAATAIIGLGTAAVKVGSDFDASMANVRAISGATEEEFDALREKALEMAAGTKFSTTEAADALSYMGMAGWTAEQMIAGLPGIMNLASAANEDLATTSDIVTDALTALNMSAADSTEFANILAAASSNSNTNVALMGETFKYCAAQAGAFHYTADDLAVAIGLMANAGIKGSMAGTSLNMVMTRLSGNVNGAADACKELGFSFYDEAGAARPLGTILDEMREATKNMTDAEKAEFAQTVAGTSAKKGLLAILNASEDDYNKLTSAVDNCNGKFQVLDETTGEVIQEFDGMAEYMAYLQLDTLAGDITRLSGELSVLGVAISDNLEGPLRGVAGFAREIVADLTNAVTENGLSGLVDATGDVLSKIVTKIVDTAPELINTATQLIHSFCESLKNTEGLGTAGMELVRALVKGIISVAGDLASTAAVLLAQLVSALSKGLPELTGIGIGLINKLTVGIKESMPQMISAGLDALLGFSSSLRENFGLIVDAGLNMVTALADSIIQNIPKIVQTVPDIITNFCGLINDNAPKILKTGVQIIKSLAKGIIDSIPVIRESIPKIIKAIVSVWEAVNWANLGKNAIAAIKNGINAVKGKLPEIMRSIGEKAKSFFASIDWHSVGKTIVTLVWEGIKAVAHLIPSALKLIGEAALAIVKTLPSLILNVLGIILSLVVEFGADLLGKAKTAAKNAVNAVNDWFSQLPGKIWVWLSDIITKVVTWAADLYNRASTAASDTVAKVNDWFSQLPGKIWVWLSDIIAKVIVWAADLLSKASTAASDTVAKVNEWFSTLPGKIWTWLCDIISKIITWGADLLSKASTAASDTVAKVNEWFSTLPGKIWTWLSTVISNVITWAADLLSRCSTAASDAVAKMNEWFSGLPGKIWTHLQTVISNVTTWAADLLSKCGTAASDAVAKVVEWFSGLPDKVKTHLDSVISNVTSWASDLASKGAEAAKGLYDAVVDGISGLPDKMYEIGSNICSGIYDGIQSGWNWLKNTVSNLASSLFESAKSALGISSPSKVFRYGIGRWIPPGIAEGFEDAMPDLMRQMDQNLDAVIDKMQARVDFEMAGITIKNKAAGEYTASTEAPAPAQNYHEEKFVQNNTYNTPVASPSEVSKAQREAARKLLGGVM